MSDLVVGNPIDVPLTIVDTESGELVDPTTLDVFVTAPDESEAHYVFPFDAEHITREATGVYMLTWVGNLDGRWFWRAEATGVGVGVGDGFVDIRPLHSHTGGPIPDLEHIELEIVVGDDYQLADGRAFEWAASQWPAIADAEISVKFRRDKTNTSTTFPGVVVNASKVRLELAAADTKRLVPGRYGYAVKATLSDDAIATIAVGTAMVVAAP